MLYRIKSKISNITTTVDELNDALVAFGRRVGEVEAHVGTHLAITPVAPRDSYVAVAFKAGGCPVRDAAVWVTQHPDGD